MSDGAAGSGNRKGKTCTKTNPANLAPAHEDTYSCQHVALWALHSLQSARSDLIEKWIKAKNTSFRKEPGISAQQTLCMDEYKICNPLCHPWTDHPHQIQWAQTTKTVAVILIRPFVPNCWVAHTPGAAWSLALTSPPLSPLLFEQCRPWPSVYTKSLGNKWHEWPFFLTI